MIKTDPEHRKADMIFLDVPKSGQPYGYNPLKRVTPEKRPRHDAPSPTAAVDALVQPAGTQDRDGAMPVIALARPLYPWITKVFADMGYQGAKLATALDRFSSLGVASLGCSRNSLSKYSATARIPSAASRMPTAEAVL